MAINYIPPKIWGTDVLLQDGDIVPTSTKDISIISNIDNVKQAVVDRLKTEVGELAYDDIYGLDLELLIGRKHTVEREELLRLSIINALRQEPRIKSISKVQVVSDKSKRDIIYVDIVIVPVQSQGTVSLNLIYPYWTLTLVDKVVDESETSISDNYIDVLYDIYSVEGVWISTDTNHVGTNYYLPSGSFSNRRISLGTRLPSNFSSVIVNYTRKVPT